MCSSVSYRTSSIVWIPGLTTTYDNNGCRRRHKLTFGLLQLSSSKLNSWIASEHVFNFIFKGINLNYMYIDIPIMRPEQQLSFVLFVVYFLCIFKGGCWYNIHV